jgi:histidine triad (HIT) family protein
VPDADSVNPQTRPTPAAAPSIPRHVCIFCDIIAGFEPARVHYRDDEVIVFENTLGWVPIMLLAVPIRHMQQKELWENMGHIAKVAAEIGERLCPNGFRLVSNFLGQAVWLGDAHQSQEHAHIHILGGCPLGPYVNPYRGH